MDRRFRSVSFLLIALSLHVAGCAMVNPKPDYEKARALAANATGHDDIYQPDQDAVIESRVDELLRGGLTVDVAVQIALLNNRDLQAAWMSIGMARADYVQSGLLSNPTASMSLRFPAAGGTPDITGDLAQEIADLWKLPARKRGARHSLDQAIVDLADKAAKLMADAKQAYYDAAGARLSLEIAEQNLTIAKRLLDFAVIRQKAGAAAETDVNLSREPVLEAELAVKAARLQASESRLNLAKLLNLTVNAEQIALRDTLPQPPTVAFDDQRLMALAREYRLDLKSAQHAIAAAQAAIDLQMWSIVPSVTAGASTERSNTKAEPGRKILHDTAAASIAGGALTAPSIEPRSARRAAKSANANAVITGPSFGMTLPIFDQNLAQIAKARFAYQQAVKNYELLDRNLMHDVRGALERAQTAWDIANFYHDRSVPLAQRNLDLGMEAYRAGKSSLLEILELQRFLLDTRNKYADALHDAAVKISDLERAVGLPMNRLLAGVPTSAPASAPAKQ